MNKIEKEAPVRSEASIDPLRRSARRHVRVALLALGAGFVLLWSVGASSAMANFGITSFSNVVTNQDGTLATQAGSHPYVDTVNMTFTTDSNGLPTENVKDVVVKLPPGLIGDPNATPKCTVQ
jgi:predicted secreted protein